MATGNSKLLLGRKQCFDLGELSFSRKDGAPYESRERMCQQSKTQKNHKSNMSKSMMSCVVQQQQS
eukprot:scaffold13692_cov104-Skeletonema_marinoi.AAC.4